LWEVSGTPFDNLFEKICESRYLNRMPRKARIDAPGALQHIIARGIERREIFIDETDRDDFLTRLGWVLADTQTECYAWARSLLCYWGMRELGMSATGLAKKLGVSPATISQSAMRGSQIAAEKGLRLNLEL
jgi:hypothetical protein